MGIRHRWGGMDTRRAREVLILCCGAFSVGLFNGDAQVPPAGRPADAPAISLKREIATDAGSTNAPLLFCIGLHVEPLGARVSSLVPGGVQRLERRPLLPPQKGSGPPFLGKRPPQSYEIPFLFRRHVQDVHLLAAITEQHGGKLTVQAQTPFTRVAAEAGESVLAELEGRGHEIALHFHEDAHLGPNGGALPVEIWAAVMREEIDWLKKAGATRVRYWSGGNLYPGVLNAAAQAGLQVMSDHKNPRVQRTFPELLSIHPWRPAGGPTAEDIAAFARHDATGRIVYLPDGIFTRTDFNSMRRTEFAGSEAKYFDFLADSLRASLKAARADRVNVFHITVHAGEFRGGPDTEKPFGVIDRWLTDAVDPLVKAGKVKWATFSEMADAFRAWEKENPGGDPRAAAGATISAVGVPASPGAEPSKGGTPTTFFAVHCEAGTANPVMWDALTSFVGMADRYGAKLTLMFNPQWAEFICPDKERFERVKTWQKAGHEVAVHYHNVVHGGWNGYTNRKDERYTRDRRYRGTVPPMMASLQKLAAPDTMLTMCMGPDARWDSLSEVEIDEPDYPDGILYDVDGMDVGLTRLMKTKFKGRDLFHLKHHFFAPDRRAGHLDQIKEEFRRAKPGEVLGVVTHEGDFARSPEFIEQWFQFCRENKARIQTVREIVRSYPQDKVAEVKYVRQETGPAAMEKPGQRAIFVKVRKFQELLRASKAENADTTAAEELDRKSREAARSGDHEQAGRLLDRASELLEQLKKP